MLVTQFQKIGLNDNEREVYLAILKAGKTTHERVARASGVNRTTVYSIAEKLKRLGLITEDLGAKVSYLVAEDPGNLISIFRREELRITDQKRTAEAIVKELKSMTLSEKYSVPRIRFVEDDDLRSFFKKQLSSWTKSGLASDNTYWGFQDHDFTEKYQDLIDWSWENIPADTKVRFFTNQAEIEGLMQKKYEERLVRTLPGESEFDSSLWVIGDYIIMAYCRERPHYMVEIHDTVLARNQRQLFKSLWNK